MATEQTISIVRKTLERFPGITEADVMGASRRRPITAARHACIRDVWVGRPSLTNPQIARIFNVTPMSVLYAIDRAKRYNPGVARSEAYVGVCGG